MAAVSAAQEAARLRVVRKEPALIQRARVCLHPGPKGGQPGCEGERGNKKPGAVGRVLFRSFGCALSAERVRCLELQAAPSRDFSRPGLATSLSVWHEVTWFRRPSSTATRTLCARFIHRPLGKSIRPVHPEPLSREHSPRFDLDLLQRERALWRAESSERALNRLPKRLLLGKFCNVPCALESPLGERIVHCAFNEARKASCPDFGVGDEARRRGCVGANVSHVLDRMC